VTGPGWLAAGFAALMLLVAVCCAARVVLCALRGRDTELDADAAHILMGVAMAGMFEPRLRLLPGPVWLGLFAAAAAWFTRQAVRARGRGQLGRLHCAVPAPHAVECAVMLYMLRPDSLTGNQTAAAMPGMHEASATAVANPALAVILAVFMLGYVMWTTDRLAARNASRSGSALAPRLAASYKMVMGIGMGYMLITLL
jgi:hypothetical protein